MKTKCKVQQLINLRMHNHINLKAFNKEKYGWGLYEQEQFKKNLRKNYIITISK